MLPLQLDKINWFKLDVNKKSLFSFYLIVFISFYFIQFDISSI